MTAPYPIPFTWDAERSVMVPKRPKIADTLYVDGEEYRLEAVEERSVNSHNHYFAAIHEAWTNLPDALAERHQTAEHLRHYALIKSGFCDERSIVCASKAEAQRVAGFIKPMDTYALVIVSECVVRVFTAKSQSRKAMGKEDFQQSKKAVLETISAMIGVDPAALSAHARAA